jgi:hypothetical protein
MALDLSPLAKAVSKFQTVCVLAHPARLRTRLSKGGDRRPDAASTATRICKPPGPVIYTTGLFLACIRYGV